MESISFPSNLYFSIVNNFFKPFCDISEISLKKIITIEIDNISLKKKYSSLKMDNITVIKLNDIVKQRGIKGYNKLRKAELIQKLKAHPDVNEQVLKMSYTEIPNILVDSVALPNKPLSNLEIIDAAIKL